MMNKTYDAYINDILDQSDLIKWIEGQPHNVFSEAAKLYDEESIYPKELMDEIGKSRLYSLYIGGKYNINDRIEYYGALNRIAREFPSLAALVAVQTAFVIFPLLEFANEDIQKRYLEPLLNGEITGAFASFENQTAYSLSRMSTTAKELGGKYRITGTKNMVSNADNADFFIVVSKMENQQLGFFIVDRDTPGLIVKERLDMDGRKAFPVFPVEFQNIVVPLDNYLSGDLPGLEMLKLTRKKLKKAVSFIALGMSKGLMDLGVSYLKKDRNLGKPLIANFGVQEELSKLHIDLTALNTTLQRVAIENLDDEVNVAHIKYKSNELALMMAETFLRLSTGSGAQNQADFSRYYRDAQMLLNFAGSSKSQIKIISQMWQ
ncbi:acyl-CoA/acyl-ACP dehydrogenase [Aerococcaceae bacterium DSM 111176]|nr:acyl-CoA/acyl-ACP dehydrogenase [Aerococcaceae bacterium DSM 111176]